MKKVLNTTRAVRALGPLTAVGALLALSACGGGDTASAEPDENAGEAASAELISDGALTVCSTFNNPPNTFREEDGSETGVEIEIAAALAEGMGLEPAWHEVAFSGIIPALQAGQCDVIMASLYIRPEREEIADFVPYLMAGTMVAVPDDNPAEITGYDDTLCGVRAIAVTGSTGAGLLDEKSEECQGNGDPAVTITLVDRGTDALSQIVAGQQDAYVNTVEQLLYFEMEHEGFTTIGEPFGEVEIGAATLKGTEGLHDALSEAFDELVGSGQYEEILQTWGLERQSITAA